MELKKVTVPDVLRMKAAGERITMVTAYDHAFARLLDEAAVDLLLVGDSLGMVVQGLPNTLPVTLDEIVYHTRIVVRGRQRALVVGDLPFGSYQASPTQAVESAVRLVKEGGAEAVKLEGGITMARTIEAIAAIDVPVMGHVGLTPQSVHRMGGHRVQGRRSGKAPGERDRVLDDARAVQAAGAFAVVLECIPLDLAADITAELTIPTIGIGAGAHCDGQVLVLHDLIGLSDAWTPRFAKRYAEVGREVVRAASAYVQEVKGGVFPSAAQAFKPGKAIAG
ncbi:MAG TPA: 3-methyl-2-oxobutanoate hydroxymethyltransferase [Candidatus Binatus sp.]|nr:3-methyl-2-oxobutanoate hydroxymethyltransferase [Candidatus Binatus sp.]